MPKTVDDEVNDKRRPAPMELRERRQNLPSRSSASAPVLLKKEVYHGHLALNRNQRTRNAEPHQKIQSPGTLVVLAALSYCGDWFSTVALMATLFQLTGPAGPALYMVARILPRPFGASLGGHATDYFGVYRATKAALLLQGAATGSLVLALHVHSPVLLLLFTFASQLGAAILRPAFPTLLRLSSPPSELKRWLSLDNLGASVAITTAPALGALLLAIMGPQAVVAFDAFTFFLLAIAIRSPQSRTGQESAVSSKVGLCTILGRYPLALQMAIGGGANFAMACVTQAALAPIALSSTGSSSSIGLFYSAVGVGSVVGALAALRVHVGSSRLVFVMGIETISLMLIAVAPGAGFIMCLLAMSSIAGGIYGVCGMRQVAALVPMDIAGRVNGAIFSVAYSAMLLGALASVPLLALAGWQNALAITGGTCLLAIGFPSLHAWFSSTRAATLPGLPGIGVVGK